MRAMFGSFFCVLFLFTWSIACDTASIDASSSEAERHTLSVHGDPATAGSSALVLEGDDGSVVTDVTPLPPVHAFHFSVENLMQGSGRSGYLWPLIKTATGQRYSWTLPTNGDTQSFLFLDSGLVEVTLYSYDASPHEEVFDLSQGDVAATYQADEGLLRPFPSFQDAMAMGEMTYHCCQNCYTHTHPEKDEYGYYGFVLFCTIPIPEPGRSAFRCTRFTNGGPGEAVSDAFSFSGDQIMYLPDGVPLVYPDGPGLVHSLITNTVEGNPNTYCRSDFLATVAQPDGSIIDLDCQSIPED